METRLISERNYWKNKFEMQRVKNTALLEEIREWKATLKFAEKSYSKSIEAYYSVVKSNIEKQELIDELEAQLEI